MKYSLLIAILISIDQLLKLFIYKNYIDCKFIIVRHLLEFCPKINRNMSYAGNFIKLFSNIEVAVIFNILIIFIFITGYAYYIERVRVPGKIAILILISGLAGSICSLIDKLLWGGSLDYIRIPNFFIFDLKDIYLALAEILFIIIGLAHQKEISVKNYLMFCARMIKKNIKLFVRDNK